MQQREYHPGYDGYDNRYQQQQLPAHSSLKSIDNKYAGKRAHYHNTFKRDVHNAASLGEHASERYHKQRYREKHCLLNKEI
jgi:hypothetical protein